MLRDLFSLFPACAGVILCSRYRLPPRATFPRMCGGDPHIENSVAMNFNFSPHVRG